MAKLEHKSKVTKELIVDYALALKEELLLSMLAKQRDARKEKLISHNKAWTTN